MENQGISDTPYDDVFRTLLNDCSRLIIPVIHTVSGEQYSGKDMKNARLQTWRTKCRNISRQSTVPLNP